MRDRGTNQVRQKQKETMICFRQAEGENDRDRQIKAWTEEGLERDTETEIDRERAKYIDRDRYTEREIERDMQGLTIKRLPPR